MGWRQSTVAGTRSTVSARASTSGSGCDSITIGRPLRARICCTAARTRSMRASVVQMMMTVMCSSMSASGPCFNSPALIPSVWMYVSSLIFSAASRPMACWYPRPSTSTDLASAMRSAIALTSGSVAVRHLVSTDGSSCKPLRICSRRGPAARLSSHSSSASKVMVTICDVKALVLATPISGPQFKWAPKSVWREMAEPTVLVKPTRTAPNFLQCSMARSVSAVSPDCETKQQMSSRNMRGARSMKSEAFSTAMGTSTSSSNSGRTVRHALRDVPQLMKTMRRALLMMRRLFMNPPRAICCVSQLTRPRMEPMTVSTCS
mmetsp:Transcript_16126/g.50007  ORF Transcript_16126/g.50007 Transcript_16126/m.50007 type:complete len:319 (-) Transcript_16126:1028-1984(-)